MPARELGGVTRLAARSSGASVGASFGALSGTVSRTVSRTVSGAPSGLQTSRYREFCGFGRNSCLKSPNTAFPPLAQAPLRSSLVGLTNAAKDDKLVLNSVFVQQIRGKKYRPFIKPRPYKHLEDDKNRIKQERKGGPSAADLLAGKAIQPEDEKVASTAAPSVSSTPFQGMRFLKAFHLDSDIKDIFVDAKLDVDLSRESVRGVCTLPNGLRAKTKLLVFCRDDEAKQMMALGADFAGLSEPIHKIQQGWLGFDRCIATPSIMREVLKVARILGPKRLMPSPKSGTVVENLEAAIREVKGGAVLEYRAEGEGNITVTVGDTSFANDKLLENMKFFLNHLLRSRPKAATANLIADATDKKDANKPYFVHADLFAPGTPKIHLDIESCMPNSAGYFR